MYECSRTEPPPTLHKSTNENFDSRDDSSSPIGIIDMINRTINHGYDSRDDYNSPLES